MVFVAETALGSLLSIITFRASLLNSVIIAVRFSLLVCGVVSDGQTEISVVL